MPMKAAAYIVLFCITLGAIFWTLLSLVSAYAKGILTGILICGIAAGILITMVINDAAGDGNGLPFVG